VILIAEQGRYGPALLVLARLHDVELQGYFAAEQRQALVRAEWTLQGRGANKVRHSCLQRHSLSLGGGLSLNGTVVTWITRNLRVRVHSSASVLLFPIQEINPSSVDLRAFMQDGPLHHTHAVCATL
jgi:hypothetical protein